MVTARKSESREQAISRVFNDLRRIVQVLYAYSRPTRVSDLARDMHLNPATVVRVLGRLETRGLVVRTNSAEDNRFFKVALTHKGMKLAEKMPVVPKSVILMGLRKIPKEQLQMIAEGMESLANILGTQKTTPLLFFSPVLNGPNNHHAR